LLHHTEKQTGTLEWVSSRRNASRAAGILAGWQRLVRNLAAKVDWFAKHTPFTPLVLQDALKKSTLTELYENAALRVKVVVRFLEILHVHNAKRGKRTLQLCFEEFV
jgi:hypothetical protein